MSEQVDKNFFPRLKRLFSTDVVIRNVGGKQLKTVDVHKIQSFGNVNTNSMIDRFTRLHISGQNPIYNPALNYQTLRTQMYSDYEAMDTEPIIASVLDIVADESTLKNESGEVLQIRSSDERVQSILYNLFYDVLNIEFNLWSWIRGMCKHGDFYLQLQISEDYGIFNVKPMSAYELSRKEGQDPENPSLVQFEWDPSSLAGTMGVATNNKIVFDNFEIAHFRLITDSNYLPYGRSFIEPARKVYKQYTLMKDAMLIHRVMRAPDKRVFHIDVGNIPPNEVDTFMQKVINKMKKTPFFDDQTGDYNLKYNMQNITEDFFIPVRGDKTGNRIDNLKGLEYNGIEDVKFLRDEMLSALKVPKAFLGFEADLEGKATLAAEDIRFARTIERIQRIVTSELTKVALIHLYSQGFKGEDLVNFELSLTSPSVVYEQEKVALWREKIDLANSILDTKLLPSDWIYDNIFQLSEDQYEEMRDLIIEDKKREFRLTQVENEGNDPAQSGKSYGTPHDLAALYGKGRLGQADELVDGYDEKEDNLLGRPVEKASDYGTQDSNLGKDPIGKDVYKKTNVRDIDRPAGNSALALENVSAKLVKSRSKSLLERLEKKLSIDKKDSNDGLLNEENIKDI
jgi:hypothetical protein